MRPFQAHRPFAVLLGLLSVVSLTLACALLPSGLPGVGAPGQEGQAEPPDGGQADDGSQASEDNPLADGGGPPPAVAACPSKAQQAVLFISHTFDWSPNRDKSVAEINGQTDASAPCPLTIEGHKVTAGPCRVSYSNTGVIHGSDGDCQVQGQGQAEVMIEGSCDQGKLTLTITETSADESPGAMMTCPNQTSPYVTYYPPSLTTRTFQIQVGGADASEDVDPDLTNQFSYHKTWSLRVEGLTEPLPPE
jgi:hypothetical protein